MRLRRFARCWLVVAAAALVAAVPASGKESARATLTTRPERHPWERLAVPDHQQPVRDQRFAEPV